MIKTRTAQVFLQNEKVIVVKINKEVKQTLEDAKENLAGSLAVGRHIPRPILIDIRSCQPLEAQVRHYYSGKQLIQSFTALALLVDGSPLGRMMGNVYFRVAQPGIPTQLFVDEEKAMTWLNGFVDG